MTRSDSPGFGYGWQQTKLWRMIQDNHSPLASDISSTLNGSMPDIQIILSKGGTSSTDFTLHDDGHAFRVAERMCKIIPDEVLEQLTEYEIAFLLLSAYLHDIGMTPELKKITSHHHFLLTGEDQALSKGEIQDFQKWLDDEGRGITPPLTRTKPTVTDLMTAQEIITYYARARHNDWGAEWINHHLGACRLGKYKNWVHDMIKLCRSHHMGYNELKESPFNPIVVNPGGIVVHLRYLACVLRIADILEFDPERTPSVIFRHRNVSPSSRIFWWRDHDVTLVQENNNLMVHARPSDAPTEHAIRLMVDSINSELQICRTLDEQTHFEICPGLVQQLPHRWDLSTTVSMNIVPKEGTYEYINGSFRPNTDKLLQLLSGTALYGDPLVAVRELLQNAFDAVREKIAYSRLSQKIPSDPMLASKIGDLHTVSLKFECDDEGFWLDCTDNGVGMTRSIIENHLLVSGTSARHDVLELERKCLGAGFPLGRTGQFGIGVLSYFMIADRIVISTKRGEEAGDNDGIGWRFETGGVGSFGELRRNQNLMPGTLVRLHLREDVVGPQPQEWFTSLTTFIKKTLQLIPCKFELSTSLHAAPILSYNSGWCRKQEDFENDLLSQIKGDLYGSQNKTPVELLSSTGRQEIKTEEKRIEILRNEVRKFLRWKVLEGEILDGTGRFRIHLPYFELMGDASLAFFRISGHGRNLIVKKMGKGYMFLPEGETHESWKGMTVVAGSNGWHQSEKLNGMMQPTFLEVDWQSPIAGSIAVNRAQFHVNNRGNEYETWIMRNVEGFLHEFMKGNLNSVFGLLNRKLTVSDICIRQPLRWLSLGDEDRTERKWRPLKFPLIPGNTYYSKNYREKITWKRSKVSVSGNIQQMNEDETYEGLTWHSRNTPPDRIMLLEQSYARHKMRGIRRPPLSHNITMVPTWTTIPKLTPCSHAVGMLSAFPEKWETLCGVKMGDFFAFTESAYIWNCEHPLISLIDSEGQDWCTKNFAKSLDPIPLKHEVLSTSSRASAWVIKCLSNESRELWDGLKDRDSTFLVNLWDLVFSGMSGTGSRKKVICMWVSDESGSKLCVLNSTVWREFSFYENKASRIIMEHLPDPGLEWKVILH